MNIKKVDNSIYDVCAVSSDGSLSEDKRSVINALISRSFDLESKYKLVDQAKVDKFLLTNLLGYNHASIADCSLITLFCKNFGWITSLMLKDDPLFSGIETSLRALKPFSLEKCLDSLDKFQYEHDFWNNIYFSNIQKYEEEITKSGVYKYDNFRWSLPGTVRTSIIFNFSARVLSKQIARLNTLENTKILSEELLKGMSLVAPNLTKCLSGKNRIAYQRWKTIPVKRFCNQDIISIIEPENLAQKFANGDFSPRTEPKTMLDDTLKFLGLFKVNICCNILIARDLMRHRTWHPFIMYLLVDKFNKPILDLQDNICHPDLIESVKEKINNWNPINKHKINIFDLYEYPLGILVEIEAFVSLNFLIYALELRSMSAGADERYIKISKKGLDLIKSILQKNQIPLDFFLL